MQLEARNAMFRVVVHRTPAADRWILQGRITGQAASELAAAWSAAQREHAGRKTVIDVIDVTSVDERGERTLMEMMADGAQFVGRGIYTTSLLENLSERCRNGA